MAQKKQFTLEDLCPGGNRYYEMTPERRYYEWWGDELLRLYVDKVCLVDIADNSEKVLFDISDINKASSDSDSTRGINLLYSTFPYAKDSLASIRIGSNRLLFNFKQRKILDRWNTQGSLEWNAESKISAFLKDDNLWVRKADGTEKQLTSDGCQDIVYGQSVHRDEFGITKGTFFSHDGKRLAFYRMDQSMVDEYPLVNNSTRMATLSPEIYPMAGETSHKVTISVYDSVTDSVVNLKLGDPTDRYFTNIQWSPDGNSIYLFELNREQTIATLDQYDVVTGEKIATLYTEADEKYVEPLHPIFFLPWDANRFIMLSQKCGFMRLYLVDINGNIIKQVSPSDGVENKEYVISDVIGFCEDTKSIIVRANISDNLNMDIVSINIDNGKLIQLSPTFGVATGTLSRGGKKVLVQYSNPNIPRGYEVYDTTTGRCTSLFYASNPWEDYAVPTIKSGKIIAADGKTPLNYRIVLPTDFDENKKYPAVLYVYGGPHVHLIGNSWNYAARPWEIYMAQKGYITFVLDNRGSDNRGKEFEQVTYRQLGQVEMLDQMKGVDYLTSLPYVDSDRIGVHGWSFGGFMTISLMLNYPEVFKVGVAGGPVIDWKWYEVMYGERYMDTPKDNPDGYEKTSLLTKAKNLKGRLQVITGLNDPVVLPQHCLSFIAACNDSGTQPDFYVYPGAGHNVRGHLTVHLNERITRYFEDFLK